MTNILPHSIILSDDDGIEVGTIMINYECTSFTQSKLEVTLNMNDGYSIAANSFISILDSSGDKLTNSSGFSLANITVTGGGPQPVIFMEAKPSHLEFSIEVNGFTLYDKVAICHECGDHRREFAYYTEYLEDGFEVHAYAKESDFTTDDNHTQGLARYMHTDLHKLYIDFDSSFVSDEVGTCLIIQENETVTPYSNSGGGNITFNFTDIDDNFAFQLFNVHYGATVFVFESGGKVTSISVGEGISKVQTISVTKPTSKVTIQFEGAGAVCGIKSCLTGTRVPGTPFNNMPAITYAPSDAPSPSPSSVPSSSPTDCAYKHRLTEDQIISQIGTTEPMPETAVMIMNGTDHMVSVSLTNLWSNYTNVSFFVQYHSQTHDTICEGIPDFAYEDSITKDMECYDGWTDMGIFIYPNSVVTIDECEACGPPDSDEDDILAYYFELPCESICEPLVTQPPTSSPTDCDDLHVIEAEHVIKQKGSDIPLPEGTITITNSGTDTVNITISQLWNDEDLSFFINYHSKSHNNLCEATQQFGPKQSIELELECYNKFSVFSMFVYLDGNMTIEECEDCKEPADGDVDVIAYYFEIPCMTMCESAIETPVTVPPSVAPTDCYDKHSISEGDVVDKFGHNETFPENAIRIINGEHTNVTLEFTQIFSKDGNISVYFHYHAVGHGTVCEGMQNFTYEETVTKNIECYDGWTDLGVFMYYDQELTFDECEECTPPGIDDQNVVAYYFEVPCEPICEDFAPSEAPSPSLRGKEAVTNTAEKNTMCEIKGTPFTVEESPGSTVDVSFKNVWGSELKNVDLSYDGCTDEKEHRQLNVSLGVDMRYQHLFCAKCDDNNTTKIEVLVFFKDQEVGFCSGEYLISCSDDGVISGSDANRKLADSIITNKKIDEFEDTPYCAHKEYPCKGDEENMVYVCHYSSRAGYQTFCMPELDSDVIRFNNNHHCGPCDGWNGVEYTGHVN
jgi:hypothetical protein